MNLKRIVLAICIIISVNVYAQDNISLKVENMTLESVFKTIQEKTGYRFFYSDDLVDLDKLISINVKSGGIETLVSQLQQQTKLVFRLMEDKLIVVEPANTPQQNIIINGKITSEKEKEGLPGVNVVVKGTTNGVVTNLDGSFTIKVPTENSVLTFSFIGFESQEISINGRRVIDVVLKEDVESLDEVVVTALAIERNKNSLGYSITQVGSDDINQAKENNPINSLVGKVSGLQITKSPTGVDGSSRVILRGVASMLGNNRPLFVIDGIPMDAGHGGAGRWGGKDGGDALADLNPEDIASMSVLKGAGAAAAYGSRGANGVILITTKKGKNKKGIGVSVSSSCSMDKPMVTPSFQNDYTQGAFGLYPSLAGNPPKPLADYPWIWSYGTKIENQMATNWLGNEEEMSKQPNPYDEFFRTGTSFTNTISFDAGNENTTFRTSLTNQDSKGIMPNNKLSRQTINLRGFSKLGNDIEFDSKLTYIRSKVRNRPHLAEDGANVVQSLAIMPRNISLQSLKDNTSDENGNMLKWNTDNTFSNPYWIIDNKKNTDEKNRLQAMFSVSWRMHNNFKVLVRSGIDYSNSNSKDYENPGRPSISVGKGSMSQGMSNKLEWNSDFFG